MLWKKITVKFFYKNKLIVKCMKDCSFYMKFSKRNAIDYLKVLSFTKDHTCNETPKHGQVKAECLDKKFFFTLKRTPNIEDGEFNY